MLKKSEQQPKAERNFTYLNFSEGKVVVNTPKGKEYYAEVSGNIQDITLTERQFKGAAQKYWYITLTDAEEAYKVGFYYENSGFKGVVMSLRNSGVKSTDKVTFRPYLSGTYTNVEVLLNGQPLKWSGKDALPDVDKVEVGGKLYTDTSKRMQFIEAEATKIKEGLN